MDQDQESAIAVFTAIAIIAVYLLPFFIGSCRAHKQAPLISIVNLFLGWTLIGWVAALIWAFTNNVYEKQDEQAQNDGLVQHPTRLHKSKKDYRRLKRIAEQTP